MIVADADAVAVVADDILGPRKPAMVGARLVAGAAEIGLAFGAYAFVDEQFGLIVAALAAVARVRRTRRDRGGIGPAVLFERGRRSGIRTARQHRADQLGLRRLGRLQHRIGIGVFVGEHLRDRRGQVGPVALAAFRNEFHPAISIVARAAQLLDHVRNAGRLRRRDRGPASGGTLGPNSAVSEQEDRHRGTAHKRSPTHISDAAHATLFRPAGCSVQSMTAPMAYCADQAAQSIDRAI